MTRRWIIGLASGSTVDGVDAALLEIDGAGLDLRLKPLHTLHLPYPRDLRELLLRVGHATQSSVKQTSLLHRLLGETFAAAARQVADQASFSLQKVQCVGCPGHTIWHEPEGRYPSTLALGMAAVVAERTGLTVVGDFRARDVALGGQGVPLSALVDYLLFRDAQEHRLLLHLGGLTTVVYLPAGGSPRQVIGFQAGPCNVLLDGLMRQLTGGRETFDPGGKHAVQGCCIEELLEALVGASALATACAVQSAAAGIRRCLRAADVAASRSAALGHARPDVYRHALCRSGHPACAAAHAASRAGSRAAQRRWRAQRPAVAFARTAIHRDFAGEDRPPRYSEWGAQGGGLRRSGGVTVDGVPANLMMATGASGSRLLGSLTPGSTGNWARCVAWMAQQTAPLRVLALHGED